MYVMILVLVLVYIMLVTWQQPDAGTCVRTGKLCPSGYVHVTTPTNDRRTIPHG